MDNKDKTVSVVVDRIVAPGKVEQFKRDIKQIIAASAEFPGYLGTDVINPEGDNRYIIVFRFASQTELDNWSESEERNYWVSKIDKLAESPTKLITLTGLETWFYLNKSNQMTPPPRYKMAVVTYIAISPTIMVFNLIFGPYLAAIPEYMTIFITAPFIVILMTYVVMPLMTKLFKGYLYPK